MFGESVFTRVHIDHHKAYNRPVEVWKFRLNHRNARRRFIRVGFNLRQACRKLVEVLKVRIANGNACRRLVESLSCDHRNAVESVLTTSKREDG